MRYHLTVGFSRGHGAALGAWRVDTWGRRMHESEWDVSTDVARMLGYLLGTDWAQASAHEWDRRITDRKASLWAAACWRLIEPHNGIQEGRAVDVEAGVRGWREMVADMTPEDNCSGSHRRQCQQLSSTWAALLRDVVGNPFQPVTVDPAYLTDPVRILAVIIYEGRRWDCMYALADALEEAGCIGSPKLQCSRCGGCGYVKAPRPVSNPVCPTCQGAGGVPGAEHPILAHLRGPGPHARGCWVLDLLLGKE